MILLSLDLNDNQVSINTTIEVDLTGQCASESIGYRQFSGTGGQVIQQLAHKILKVV
jgi:acyl-CoA hydrolase